MSYGPIPKIGPNIKVAPIINANLPPTINAVQPARPNAEAVQLD